MDSETPKITLECADSKLSRAFEIAVGDVLSNVRPYVNGIVKEPALCLTAGQDYPDTWVRDASFNVRNGGFLIGDEVCKSTLLSCIHERGGKHRIDHPQSWDCVIWALGAWHYYCQSGDAEFVGVAREVLEETFRYYEATEWDEAEGLFCGAAVYGDGVAAYPDRYGVLPSKRSGILHWGPEHPAEARSTGLGNPMKSLSTNCAYVMGYRVLADFCRVCGKDGSAYLAKAEKLRRNIREKFRNEKTGRFDYLAGECDAAEGLGLAFSILWDVADKADAKSVAENTPLTPHGIACVYPSFERYLSLGGYGRHSGTVWPFINCFWALAMRKAGRNDLYESEWRMLTEKALRDGQFYELYHPETGTPYGGLQEDGVQKGIRLWESCRRQTWSATGYLSLVTEGVFGITLGENTISFCPRLPDGLDSVTLKNYPYRGALLTVTVTSDESAPKELTLNAGCPSQTVTLCGR